MHPTGLINDSSSKIVTKGAYIPCPRCNHLINAQAHFCEFCGVDLAIAAAMAERDLFPVTVGYPKSPMSPEILVPRLGDYLRLRGVLTEEDLQKALVYQADLAKNGQTCLVGEALIQLGVIDRETLDAVVTEQILQLQSALQDANLTLEKRVQERTSELQQALKRLAELSQLKSNFISNISHELRTPLTHIKGYLELLQDGELGDLADQQRRAVDVALRSSNRLEKLIEDLLQFSLAVRGELSLKLEDCDLIVILAKLEQGYMPKTASKSIHFSVDYPNTPIHIHVDVEKIEWVLDQLLDNAYKFTPHGGVIRVSAVEVGGLVTITVMDNGIGIPQDKINEIFQLFYQLDSSNTRRYQGTGLGLAFVHRILDAHGSQISVDSNVGLGSRFQFSLPIVGYTELSAY
jgi:signal transduction histidine kinase